MRRNGKTPDQRGAALIVVLLLVATLSFIALAIGERSVLAASRAANVRLSSELFWQAVGAEALARRAIEAAMKATPGKLVSDNPLVAAPIVAPFEGGSATITVVDRTRCFNINSLVRVDGEGGQSADEAATTELLELFAAGNAGSIDPEALAAAVVDWIDTNNFQEPKGAEDGTYTALPTPYRSGGALLADITELRAIAGVDRAAYGVVRPFLCANPNSAPSILNLNMLTVADAPLLVAILAGRKTVADAQDIINDRPPGGYGAADVFWTNEAFAGLEISDATKARIGLFSRYLEVNAAMEYYDAGLDLSLLFEVDGDGRTRLIARRFGRYE